MSVTDLFDYLKDRNQWLDSRLSGMDRRFERIDRNTAHTAEKMAAEARRDFLHHFARKNMFLR